MKGLYCKLDQSAGELKFVIQETAVPAVLASHDVKVQVKACALSPLDVQLLSELGCQRDLCPVGREVVGVVLQVGPKVTFFQPDDQVVGILPLDSEMSGLCDIVIVNEQHLVQKPERVGWVCAAGAVCDGVWAYTALHTLARMEQGHTLLLLDAASARGVLAVQLAHSHGVRVLAAAHSALDHALLDKLRPRPARVVGECEDLVKVCMEETGGLGVDIVIDSGVRLQEEEEPEARRLLPHKHDIISLLAVGGAWVTSEQGLQLDPPDSRVLYLKGASLSFLNHHVWTSSSSRQGRYLHIMKDIVEKLSTGTLSPQLEEPVSLYEALVSMETVQRGGVRRRLVVQL